MAIWASPFKVTLTSCAVSLLVHPFSERWASTCAMKCTSVCLGFSPENSCIGESPLGAQNSDAVSLTDWTVRRTPR